jgi:broad specificity phosphatase PhoE
MLKILLVRHGETDWNRIRRIQGGGSNILLNKRGEQQVSWLADRLEKERLLAVYSSPLDRALVTARAIAAPHRLGVQVEPALKEIEAGELEGKTITEVGKHFSHVLLDDLKGSELPRIPGGESLEETQRRGWEAIQKILKQYDQGTVVVVSHYFIILAVILAALELPLPGITKFRLSTGSLSAIDFDDGSARLSAFNESISPTVIG